uniref:Putative transcription coactivator n=1 Tax=Ixodes ricinus TaxID=34613 RepID=A0A0K8R9Z7_IXORI
MGPEKDVDQRPAEPAVGEKAATALDNQEKAAAPDATATAGDVAEDKAVKKETDKAPDPEANEIKMEDVASPKSNGSSDQAAASEGRRRGSRQNGESGEAQRTPRTPKKRKPRRDQNGHSQSEPESTDREGGSRPPGGQRRQRDRSDGRPRVDMDESIPESHRYVWADDVYKRSLYVGNMSAHVTKDEVRALSEAIRSVRFVNRRSAFLDV